MEREVLWGIAPHIIWPLRFVLPYQKGLRPAWMLRLGLLLYDHLGGRKRLPATRTLDLRTDAAGAPLKPGAFRDRLRIFGLLGRGLAPRGAQRPRCRRPGRHDPDPHQGGVGHPRSRADWTLALATSAARASRTCAPAPSSTPPAPGSGRCSTPRSGINTAAKVRLVQGSHIVVPKLYDHGRCYIFQNPDGRIFFAIPYETDFTLIGTTDRDYEGDPGRCAGDVRRDRLHLPIGQRVFREAHPRGRRGLGLFGRPPAL